MTRLSALQYPVLKLFVEGRPYLSIAECQKLDQRAIRSFLIREYIAYRPGRGFHITATGLAAWEEFIHHDFYRKNPTLPLTAYFDPTAYGLSPSKKARLTLVRKGAAA